MYPKEYNPKKSKQNEAKFANVFNEPRSSPRLNMVAVEHMVALEQAKTIGAFGQILQSRSRSLASAEIPGNACAMAYGVEKQHPVPLQVFHYQI
jgi:hypothetical protein